MGEWDIIEEKKVGEWDVVDELEDDLAPKPTAVTQMHRDSPGGVMPLREALPLAGDIIGSMVAPQKKILTSMPKLAKMGYRGLNMLSRGAGAGIGSMFGEGTAQKIEGRDLDMDAIFLQGELGVGSEVAASMILGPLKPLAKPLLNLVSDLSVTGSWIKKSVRNRIIKNTTKQAEEFVNDIAPSSVKEAGERFDIDQLAMATVDAMDESKAMYQAYGKALAPFADDMGFITLPETKKWVGGLYDEVADLRRPQVTTKVALKKANTPGLTPFVTDKEKRMRSNGVLRKFGWTPGSQEGEHLAAFLRGEITVGRLQGLLSGIWNKNGKNAFDSLTDDQVALRKKLRDLIKVDMEQVSPDAAKMFEDATNVRKELIRFKKIENIYRGAIRGGPGEEKFLNPSKLVKSIRNNKAKIEKEMPELWPRLEKEANFYAKMAPNFKAPNKMSAASVPGMLMGPGAATYAMGGWGIPVAESFGAISAWAYLSPKARGVLGEIIKGTLKAPIHYGGPRIMEQGRGL